MRETDPGFAREIDPGYQPCIAEYPQGGYAELVLKDGFVVTGEERVVRVLRDAEGKEAGFTWDIPFADIEGWGGLGIAPGGGIGTVRKAFPASVYDGPL